MPGWEISQYRLPLGIRTCTGKQYQRLWFCFFLQVKTFRVRLFWHVGPNDWVQKPRRRVCRPEPFAASRRCDLIYHDGFTSQRAIRHIIDVGMKLRTSRRGIAGKFKDLIPFQRRLGIRVRAILTLGTERGQPELAWRAQDTLLPNSRCFSSLGVCWASLAVFSMEPGEGRTDTHDWAVGLGLLSLRDS